jgi:hypothetical protein
MPVAIKGKQLKIKSITMPNCSRVKSLVRMASTQMSFLEMVSDRLCRNSSVVLGWHGYMWSVFVRPFGRAGKLSKTMLEAAYGREISIKLSGKQLWCHALTLESFLCLYFGLVRVWFGWAFYVLFSMFWYFFVLAWYGSQSGTAVYCCLWLGTILR